MKKAKNPLLSSAIPLIIIAAVVIFSLGLVLAPQQVRRQVLSWQAIFGAEQVNSARLATGGADGAYSAIGTTLQAQLQGPAHLELEVLHTEGSMDNLRLLRNQEADFALIQGGLNVDLQDISAVARLDREYVHVIVPADSPAQCFRDLAGKRVGVGASGSGSAALGELLTDYYQFAEAPELVQDHGADLEAAFLAGHIDAALTVYRLFTPAMEHLLNSGWYRLLPIKDADAIDQFYHGLESDVLTPHLYGPDRSLPDRALPTLAADILLVCHNDAPEMLVNTVTAELYALDFQHRAQLAGWTEAEGRQTAPIPLHPAALAYYERHAPISSDAFEIGSFFLAGLVVLASTFHYLLGRRRKAELASSRHAIMPYFEKMLDFGTAIEKASDTTSLNHIIQEMMRVQRKAESAWLGGQLDTEHMENLYSIYSIRSRNAFAKIQRLLTAEFHSQMLQHLQTRTADTPNPPQAPTVTSDTFPFDEEEEDDSQMDLF